MASDDPVVDMWLWVALVALIFAIGAIAMAGDTLPRMGDHRDDKKRLSRGGAGGWEPANAKSTMRLHTIRMGVGFGCSWLLALMGSSAVEHMALFGGKVSGFFDDTDTYFNWLGLFGLMLQAVCFPAAFCFGGAFASALFKFPELLTNRFSNVVLLGVECAGFLYWAYASWDSALGLAADVLGCGVVFCFAAPPTNTAAKADHRGNFYFCEKELIGTHPVKPQLLP